jgi:hypothetical protein
MDWAEAVEHTALRIDGLVRWPDRERHHSGEEPDGCLMIRVPCGPRFAVFVAVVLPLPNLLPLSSSDWSGLIN